MNPSPKGFIITTLRRALKLKPDKNILTVGHHMSADPGGSGEQYILYVTQTSGHIEKKFVIPVRNAPCSIFLGIKRC